MPLVDSRFSAPVLLRNGHVQTILPVLFPSRARVPFERERLELEDGDFLDLDWARAKAQRRKGEERETNGRLAILCHGLEGNSEQPYIRGLAVALMASGWDVLAWNFRGCGTEPNRLLRFYHSGETGDLGAVVRHAAQRYDRIVLAGFSLGGNVVLKYVGEAPPHPAVVAAAAVSAPVHLNSCARVLDARIGNRVYLMRFISSLIAKIEAKAQRFPDQLDAALARRVRSIGEFDDRFTAPIHGFRDAEDYWTQSSARQFLPGIGVPTLLLNARNDPLLTEESIPIDEAAASAHVFLDAPDSGGHVGFLNLARGIEPWWQQRVVEFLDTAVPMRPT